MTKSETLVKPCKVAICPTCRGWILVAAIEHGIDAATKREFSRYMNDGCDIKTMPKSAFIEIDICKCNKPIQNGQ